MVVRECRRCRVSIFTRVICCIGVDIVNFYSFRETADRLCALSESSLSRNRSLRKFPQYLRSRFDGRENTDNDMRIASFPPTDTQRTTNRNTEIQRNVRQTQTQSRSSKLLTSFSSFPADACSLSDSEMTSVSACVRSVVSICERRGKIRRTIFQSEGERGSGKDYTRRGETPTRDENRHKRRQIEVHSINLQPKNQSRPHPL